MRNLFLALIISGCGGDYTTREPGEEEPTEEEPTEEPKEEEPTEEEPTEEEPTEEEPTEEEPTEEEPTEEEPLPVCGSGICPAWDIFSENNPPEFGECVSEIYSGEYRDYKFVAYAWDINCGPSSTLVNYCWNKYGVSYERCE